MKYNCFFTLSLYTLKSTFTYFILNQIKPVDSSYCRVNRIRGHRSGKRDTFLPITGFHLGQISKSRIYGQIYSRVSTAIFLVFASSSYFCTLPFFMHVPKISCLSSLLLPFHFSNSFSNWVVGKKASKRRFSSCFNLLWLIFQPMKTYLFSRNSFAFFETLTTVHYKVRH